jgi:NADPH-dependent glutamate synthase beta subunit-like oxidoreductase
MFFAPLSSFNGSMLEERELLPPCQVACPIHQDVQKYISLIFQGQFNKALGVIKETNPFPSICSLVCFHDCEAECRRAHVDYPLSIRALKRAAVDYGTDTTAVEIKTKHDERVAIIGAGPAGLSAAYYLSILGYQVTVFEANPLPGGIMRYGIPSFRLPPSVLDAEITNIRNLGVEIVSNTRVESLEVPFLKNYQAIFVAIGAWNSVMMGIPGENMDGCYDALSFLRQVNSGKEVKLGKKVAIIGGGDTAIDAARVARRLGVNVVIIYRRSRVEMPAIKEEVNEALKEGIKLHILTAPKKILTSNGKVSGIKCQRMELTDLDDSGRCLPKPIENSEFDMAVQNVIFAIGQTSSQSPLLDPLYVTKEGTILADPVALET